MVSVVNPVSQDAQLRACAGAYVPRAQILHVWPAAGTDPLRQATGRPDKTPAAKGTVSLCCKQWWMCCKPVMFLL